MRTIKVSDKTWEKIKDQVEEKEEKKTKILSVGGAVLYESSKETVLIIKKKGEIMENVPKEMTLAKLGVLVMPNGEVICLGKQIGRFKDLKEQLSEPTDAITGEKQVK